MGLFQFLPTTFYSLDERWRLVEKMRDSVRKMENYLGNPKFSIELGARWFQDLLHRRSTSNKESNKEQRAILAVMEHNAGPLPVSIWLSRWEAADKSQDLEYMLETARFDQTRHFLRNVINTMAIARAARLVARGN